MYGRPIDFFENREWGITSYCLKFLITPYYLRISCGLQILYARLLGRSQQTPRKILC